MKRNLMILSLILLATSVAARRVQEGEKSYLKFLMDSEEQINELVNLYAAAAGWTPTVTCSQAISVPIGMVGGGTVGPVVTGPNAIGSRPVNVTTDADDQIILHPGNLIQFGADPRVYTVNGQGVFNRGPNSSGNIPIKPALQIATAGGEVLILVPNSCNQDMLGLPVTNPESKAHAADRKMREALIKPLTDSKRRTAGQEAAEAVPRETVPEDDDVE